MTDFEIFEEAFRSNHSGAEGMCVCGREFYDNYNSYDSEWVEELEAHQNNSNSTPLEHSVGYVFIDGSEFVDGCDCWLARARSIIDFINQHEKEIANYINQKKRAAQAAVDMMPTIDAV